MPATITPPSLVTVTSLSDAVMLASTLNAWLSLYDDAQLSDVTRSMAKHLLHRLQARAEEIAEAAAAEQDPAPRG